MATGPFQYDPETREFKRRNHARHWAVGEEAGAGVIPAEAEAESASRVEQDEPAAGLLNPSPRRRRRRSHAATEAHSPKKFKLWRVAMWGLILVLLVGWLVMIAVLTSQSGKDAAEDRKFEFDRGETVEPDSKVLFPE